MQGYESDRGVLTVHYDGDSYAQVNYTGNTYEVVVDGVTVAKDFVTTAPMPQGGWVIYSRGGGQTPMTLPKGVRDVEVMVLSEGEPETFSDFTLESDGITLNAKPGVPYYVRFHHRS